MPKISSRSRECAIAIGNRESFETYGALRAISSSTGSGRLRGSDLDRHRADYRDITYTVMSYDTPIAWVANGIAYHVSQRFSVTTSKHQGKTYMLKDDI